MSKKESFIKRAAGPILFIIVLLVIQAFSDLTLPEYTSKIVNIGIQQGGIEHASPEEIRVSEMDRILLFMDSAKIEKVLGYYTLGNKDDTYVLSQISKVERKELDLLLTNPITAVSLIESNSDFMKPAEQKIQEELAGKVSYENLFQLLSQLPEDQAFTVRNSLLEVVKQMPDSIIEQGAIAYVKNEYEVLGLDLGTRQMNYIFATGVKMLGLSLLAMVATVLVTLLASRVGADYGRITRKGVFQKVVGFSNNEFDKFSTASLITRTTNDIQQVQTMTIIFLRMVFYAPIVGIGGFIKVWQTTSSMAWVIGVGVLAVLTVVLVLVSLAMPKFQAVQRLIDRLNLVTREILTGLPVIRAFNTSKHEESRFKEANSDLTKTNLFVNRIMNIMMPSMMLIMNLLSILIVWVGADRINTGVMQVGDLMAFIQYAMQIVMAFLMISMISVMLPRALVSHKRIKEVLDTDTTIHDPEKPQTIKTTEKGVLEFKNVSFKYPDANEYVLNDLSFKINTGDTLAIIGSTGSGKSTLVNLIPRFYDVSEGEILLDGMDIRSITQYDLRDRLGYVPQKGVLFSGTVESNIRFGNQEASDEEVKEIASIAQASSFVEDMSGGYHAPISQGGTNVSGGQKQRLSIARALARNPEICIFDDSFSALDYKTETTLRNALNNELRHTTKIIVAQRISTVIHADQILVLDEGNLVGQGTHKELIENCEIYKQIALSQLSKEELA